MARVKRKRTGKKMRNPRRKAGKIRGTRYRKRPLELSISPSAFPNSKKVWHRYVEDVTLPGNTAGLTDYYSFLLNSAYDPNYTGAGHQPLFFDEMAAKYTAYTVISAIIKVTFSPTANQFATHAIQIVYGDTDPDSDRELFQEGRTKWVTPVTPSLLTRPYTLSRKVWMPKVISNNSYGGYTGDHDQKYLPTVSPTTSKGVFAHIVRAPVGNSTALTASTIKVEIFQAVLWRDPVTFTKS